MAPFRTLRAALRRPVAAVVLGVVLWIDAASLSRTSLLAETVSGLGLVSGGRPFAARYRPRVSLVLDEGGETRFVIDEHAPDAGAELVCFPKVRDRGTWAPTRREHRVHVSLIAHEWLWNHETGEARRVTPEDVAGLKAFYAAQALAIGFFDPPHAAALREGPADALVVTRTAPLASGYVHNLVTLAGLGCLLVALWSMPGELRRGRGRRRLLLGRCPRCAYDLAGLRGRRCPECGATWRAGVGAGR